MNLHLLATVQLSPATLKGQEIGDAVWYTLMGVTVLFVRYKKEVMRPSFVLLLRFLAVGLIVWNVARLIFLLLPPSYTKS